MKNRDVLKCQKKETLSYLIVMGIIVSESIHRARIVVI